MSEIIDQLKALAQRQYPDSELDRLKFLASLLETKLREYEYRAERARKLLQQAAPGEEEK